MSALQALGDAGNYDLGARVPKTNGLPTSATAHTKGTDTPTTPASLTIAQAVQEQLLFADESKVTGEAILDLASRYSSEQIAEKFNAVTEYEPITVNNVNNRIRAALRKRAEKMDETQDQVQVELGETRSHEADHDAVMEDTVALPTSQAPAPVALPELSPADLFLFERPHFLVGETLLSLAERYSTADISKHVGLKMGSSKPIIGASGIRTRLQTALTARATSLGTTLDDAKVALAQTRIANGVKTQTNHGAAGSSSSKPKADGRSTGPVRPAATISDVVALALQHSDHALFADQKSLTGDKILLLAEHYSSRSIAASICAIPDASQLTKGGVDARINRAVKSRAEMTGESVDTLRENLANARIANGVPAKSFGSVKTKKVAASVHEEAEPAPQADVAAEGFSGGAEEVDIQEDTEVTDVDSSGGQEGYTPDEVEAANALLALCATPPPEVLDAATTLMDLHHEDASLAVPVEHTGDSTEEEVSDTEMNGAERATFHADFARSAARFGRIHGQR